MINKSKSAVLSGSNTSTSNRRAVKDAMEVEETNEIKFSLI